MPKTLAEINAILGTETAADLTLIIADVKAAVRASDAGVIADLEAKLAAAQATAKEAADKAAAELADAKSASDAALATANAARDKAVAELAAMTAQDQKHASALLVALDWQAIDSEYTDLQSKLAANSAKYDAARVKLEELAAAINAPFAEREAAAKAARVKELEAQLAAAVQ
jgi:subtilase-type serine protease